MLAFLSPPVPLIDTLENDVALRTPKTNNGITVVGAGNYFVAHDRIGPKVIENLQSVYGDKVEVVELKDGGLGLLDVLRKQELLILVDACSLGGEPGKVDVFEFDDLPIPAGSGRGFTLHQINPYEVLKVARVLYTDQMPKRIYFVLIETGGLEDEAPPISEERATKSVMELIETEGELLADRSTPHDYGKRK